MMMRSSEELLHLVHRLRRRWMWGHLLERVAFGAFAVLGWVVLAGIVTARAPMAPVAMMILRVGTIIVLLGAAYVCVFRPLRRRPDEVTFARFIEEREPRLEDRLVTAVEILVSTPRGGPRGPSGERAGGFSPVLVQRLIADALAQCSTVSQESVLPTRVWRLRAILAVAPVVLFGALALFGPGALRRGWQQLYWPWAIAAPPGFAIRVHPGDTRIPRGLDQVVTATLHNFEAESARLVFRPRGESNWQERVMRRVEPRTFRFLFSDLQQTVEYYVEARAVRSPTFRIEVVDWPRVSRLEVIYTYPAYTGQAPRKVDDGGEITAVKGTRVTVIAHLNGRVREARLVFDDGTSVAMAPDTGSPRDPEIAWGARGEMRFTAPIVIKRDARYHVRVRPFVGEEYAASREYTITALEDAPPTIVIEKPGRDLQVTAIQEVFTEARVEDDYGVALVELRYSVNGGPEQTILLHRAGTPRGPRASGAPVRAITGSYTFFLEELNLEPGDVISYYVKARDTNTVTGPGEAASDIYFLEVRPFDRRFRQAQQMPTGQGAEERERAFAERQKEIIAATWRVLRERGRLSGEEFQANVNTLELAQTKLREDVQAVVDRMRRRLGENLEGMGDFEKLFEALSGAVREMERAADELRARRLREALPFEQRAYQHVLRADAVFREVQVALARRADGGGSARAQDLADLFELELDKMKNQYETIQRDRGRARDRQLEEVERRLRELAERQQRLLEQGLRHGAARSGEDGRLAEDVRELARRLERLTRERPLSELGQVRQQLERAARELQRARSASTEGEAAAHRQQALEHLRAARRQLQVAHRAQLGEEVAWLRERAREAYEQQERIAREVERLARGAERATDVLRERKSALAEEVTRLGEHIEDAARRARQENNARAAGSLSAAAEAIRRQRLPQRIEQGNRWLENQWLDYAAEQERAIGRALGEVVRHLDEAARGVRSRQAGDRVTEALDRARRLAEHLESLRDRLSRGEGARARGEESSSGPRVFSPLSERAGGSPGRADRSGERARAAAEPSREISGEQRAGEARRNPLGGRGPARDSVADATAFGRLRPRSERDLGEALRQLRRELDERVREAEALRRSLGSLRDLVDDASRLVAELRRLDAERLFNDPEEIERLKRQVLDPLRRLEWELHRRQPEQLGADRLRLGEEAAVPPEYRRLVEEYYRRLARRPK
ncbi:hypothetical protein HRbin08_01583 [bacterium HR08]|nr:hypothetical protein HRbin08_01583 [bacterium HR08]